jgi:hypothetical protein
MGQTAFPPDAIIRINEQLADLLNAAAAATPDEEPVAAGIVWRDSGVLTVSVGIPPTIDTQPQNATVAPDETATFAVVAINATSYQWQLDNGAGFANISGATSASYTTAALTTDENGDEYRCVVTGPGGSVTSDTVTLTVTLALPTAAVSWSATDGDASRGAIANSSSGTPLPTNILRAFSTTGYPSSVLANGVTLSTSGAYIRSVSTNNLGLTQIPQVRLAAGTYTLSMDAVSHDESSSYSVSFGTTSSLATISVTGTEATFSRTFTVASTGDVIIALLFRNTTGDAYDIRFRNFRLHAGSTDLGVDSTNGHLMLGISDVDASNPTFVTKSFRQYGVARYVASVASWTVVATVSQAGATAGTPVGIIGADSFSAFQVGSKNNNLHARITANAIDSEYGRIRNLGWIVVAVRVTNGLQELFINGVLVTRSTLAFSPYSITHLLTGALGGTTLSSQMPSGDAIHTVQLFNTAITDGELQNVIADQKQRLIGDSLTPATVLYSYHAGGDSLTFDANSYARRFFTANPTIVGEVFAVSSTGIADLTTKVNERLASIATAVASGTTPIYSVLTGVNDAVDVGTWLPQYLAACESLKAAGAKVMAFPVPPKGLTGSAHNLARGPVNDAMAAATSSYDVFVDLRANAAYANSAPSGGVYYNVDQVHWIATGYDEITPTIDAARQTIIDSL